MQAENPPNSLKPANKSPQAIKGAKTRCFSDFGSFEVFGGNPLNGVEIAVFAKNAFAGVTPGSQKTMSPEPFDFFMVILSRNHFPFPVAVETDQGSRLCFSMTTSGGNALWLQDQPIHSRSECQAPRVAGVGARRSPQWIVSMSSIPPESDPNATAIPPSRESVPRSTKRRTGVTHARRRLLQPTNGTSAPLSETGNRGSN